MIVLCGFLAVICLFDYRHARIPNWIVLFILLYGLGYRYWDAGGDGVRSFLTSCLVVLLCFYPLFKIGTIGAGDVKLYMAAAGFMSGRTLVCFLFYSLLIAAIISIFRILRERSGRERVGYLCSYLVDVLRTGQWQLYYKNCIEERRGGVCLSGPILLGILLHLGGVY